MQSVSQMLVVSICSALMGISSLVYTLDKLAPLYQRSLHFGLICILVTSMMIINGWMSRINFLSFFLEFVLIYIIIALVIMWYERSYVQKINEKLKGSKL